MDIFFEVHIHFYIISYHPYRTSGPGPCSQSHGHCLINIAGALRVLSATYHVCYPPKRRAIIQKRITVRTLF